MSHQPAPAAAAAAAGLGRRLGSICYELLLLAAVLFVSGGVFHAAVHTLDPTLARPLLQLFLFGVAAGYFVYCWTHGGQTLPMKTWRIRLVARTGGAVTLQVGIYRYLFALAGMGLCGLGLAWAIFDRDRQFLHDRLAGTKLVNC